MVSGRGGQGVLTLTRILAEAAVAAGHEVLTSETHGMAQRGGAVLAMVKVGPFHGPLISPGDAEVGLFLHAGSLAMHGHYVRAGGAAFVNTTEANGHLSVDASGLASAAGAPVATNLALLGYAAGTGGLFAEPALFEAVIRAVISPEHFESNLAAFSAGVEAAR